MAAGFVWDRGHAVACHDESSEMRVHFETASSRRASPTAWWAPPGHPCHGRTWPAAVSLSDVL